MGLGLGLFFFFFIYRKNQGAGFFLVSRFLSVQSEGKLHGQASPLQAGNCPEGKSFAATLKHGGGSSDRGEFFPVKFRFVNAIQALLLLPQQTTTKMKTKKKKKKYNLKVHQIYKVGFFLMQNAHNFSFKYLFNTKKTV